MSHAPAKLSFFTSFFPCGRLRRSVFSSWGLLAGLVVLGGGHAYAISVTDTTGWNAWMNQQGTYVVDPAADQQTGQPSDDFVGTTTTAAFQQQAGTLTGDSSGAEYMFFRARFGNYNPSGNGGNFSLGIDLTGNGQINLIMLISYKATTASISFATPGSAANDGPSTTSWGTFSTPTALTSSTFNYQGVTDGTLLIPSSGNTSGYTQNAWTTFAVSYANLQAAIQAYAAYYTQTGVTSKGVPIYTASSGYFSSFGVSDYTGMSFIAFTTTQGNAINQDLLGTSGNLNSTSTFSSLGAGSTFVRPGGGPVPEPAAAYQLGGLLGVGLIGWAWRKRRFAGKAAVSS